MGVDSHISSLRIDDKVYIMKFRVPDHFTGMTYGSLDLDKDFHLKLLGVTRPKKSRNVMGIERSHEELLDNYEDEHVESSDMLICEGTAEGYRALYERINR